MGIRKKISRQFYIPPHLYANNGLLGSKNSGSRAPSFDQFQINLWVFILSIQLMAVKVNAVTMITSVGQPEIVTGVKSFEDAVKKINVLSSFFLRI